MKEKKGKAITKKPKNQIEKPQGMEGLIQTAIKEKSGVDVMERLLKMKYEHEEREAAKLFHERFCDMQAELPVIQKTKTVENYSGEKMYSYAPLEKIVQEIKPYLKKHGFSYHWSEERIEAGMKRIHCHITGYGHSESAYVDLPIMSPSKVTNMVQQAGASITYGKRYSLIGILGIMADEDTDTSGINDGAGIDAGTGKYNEFVAELERNVIKDTVSYKKENNDKEIWRKFIIREILWMLEMRFNIGPSEYIEKICSVSLNELNNNKDDQTIQSIRNMLFSHGKSGTPIKLIKPS
jgi:hypothetical protein